MNKILILGSTGSIGKSALEVIKGNDGYSIKSLVARNNKKLILEQAKEANVTNVFLSENVFEKKDLKSCPNLFVSDSLDELLEDKDIDTVIAAFSGIVGIDSILKSIREGKKILIANKEPLVVAGKILLSEAKKYGATIIPIDSEHCAIHQCLNNVERKDVKSVSITCSGGPFWGKKISDTENVTIEEAKKHPVWNMGDKNLIDSASLMNKALEIIEARWLFDLEPEKIKVIIHPQSIIHAIIENIDGSCIASLSTPDMKICLAYGLGYPGKIKSFTKSLDLAKLGKLEFFNHLETDFPSIEFAYRALEGDETIPVALNSANEIAVSYFLNNKVKFNSIFAAVDYTMNVFEGRSSKSNLSIEDLLEIDKEAKSIASNFLN
tara:strand:- start:3519 stop:4658 length:1140 start_codon:yes stop_codon:yes gene_type:complete